MLRLALALIAAFGLALAACNSDEESPDLAVDPAPTLTSGNAGNVTICPRIGAVDEASPVSQTPPPACQPGSNFETVPGIHTTIAQPPELPAGATPLTNYLALTFDDPDTAGVIGIPLETAPPIGRVLSWYSYQDGEWRALDPVVTISESTIAGSDAFAQGSFDPLPPNLILLAED